jgi:hypothetical protein
VTPHASKVCSLLAVATSLVTGCSTTKVAEQSVFAVLTGTWGWEQFPEVGCGQNSHTMTFTKDRKVMLLKHKEASAAYGIPAETVRYRVLQSEPNLRMAIEGETRTTAEGKPVEWEVVMLTPDRFCWQRADLEAGSCSSPIVRCPANN